MADEELIDFTMGEGDAVETFQSYSWLTGADFLRYSRMMVEGGLQSVLLVDDFFRDVMPAADYERFMKYCGDRSNRITNEKLSEKFLKLFSKLTAGTAESSPTQPSASSSPGADGTTDTSAENSPSGESTPAS